MSLSVVDPHVHLWDLSTGLYPHFEKGSTGFIGDTTPIARSYLLPELLAEGGKTVTVRKIVNVEAIPTDPVKETLWLQALADETGFPQGIVANADLSAPAIEAVLDRHRAAANLRGIRQILNRHPDPFYNYVASDFMGMESWRNGLRCLAKLGLSFDMQLYPHQMAEAAKIAAANPDIVFILNHGGMFVDRTLDGWRTWRDGVKELARLPNATMKISGLGMFDHHWSVESIRPYVLTLIDAFGPDRAMFASNFPVDKLFGTYSALWSAFSTITADMSENEQAMLFGGTAERIYRI